MMFGKTVAVLALAGSVMGQSGSQTASSASPSSTTLPISTALIPSNISASCTSFLTTLNTDTTFTSCMSPLASLTALYNPISGSAENTTASSITTTLTSLCSATTGCSNALIRTYLSNFYAACTAELVSNTQVREMYDFLYVVNPLKGAVCARDGATQKYCVLELSAAAKAVSNGTVATNSTSITNSTSTNTTISAFRQLSTAAQDIFGPALALAQSNLYILTPATASLARRVTSFLSPRQSTSTLATSIITPNTTTYATTNLAFLFLLPSLPSSVLCSSCSKSVLAAYVQWEASVPYALGLSSSPILGQQQALWSAVETKCGTNWTDAVVQSAGVLSANGTMSAAVSAGGRGVVGAGAVVAVVVGAVGALLI